MKAETPTIDQVEAYLATQGRRAASTLAILGKHAPFVTAMNSEIGREILKDDIAKHEDLLKKIYEENATPQELAEFRYLKHRLKTIADRLSDYILKSQEVVSGSKKGA